MRSVVQRVSSARVEVAGTIVGEIAHGLLVLVGIEAADTDADLAWTADKIAHLRIFEDDAGKMNRSVLDVRGSILLVPNFTLAGDARKGRRPSFDNAMRPELSAGAFDSLVSRVRALGAPVATGLFRAEMRVSLTNDGPITLWLDSKA